MDARETVGCPKCLVRRHTPCSSGPMLRDIASTHEERTRLAAAVEKAVTVAADTTLLPEQRGNDLVDVFADLTAQFAPNVPVQELVDQAERDGIPDLDPILLTHDHALLAVRALLQTWAADQRGLVENDGIDIANETRDPASAEWAAHLARVADTDDRIAHAIQIATHLGVPAVLPTEVASLWDVLEDAQVPVPG